MRKTMTRTRRRLLTLLLGATLIAVPAAVIARGDQSSEPPAPESDNQDDLEEFEPTEEVRADDAISFPVDI